MVTQLPAHLLVPYLAVGAREVVEGGTLSEESRWAVGNAKLQLRAQRAVIDGRGSAAGDIGAPVGSAAGRSQSLQLASLAVGPQEPGASLAEHVERSSERLDAVIADLELLEEGDGEAAVRIRERFVKIADSYSGRGIQDDII